MRFCGIQLGVMSQWVSQLLFCMINLKIIHLKLLTHLPGANEFLPVWYKPNLVAKIWLPTLVTICNGLPKLVANISSQIPQLVNIRLNVGTLDKWLPIKVATPANYREVSNIRRTKSQNLNASRLILQLSLPNPLKPGVKMRMKM